jgi:hypothetical protein
VTGRYGIPASVRTARTGLEARVLCGKRAAMELAESSGRTALGKIILVP